MNEIKSRNGWIAKYPGKDSMAEFMDENAEKMKNPFIKGDFDFKIRTATIIPTTKAIQPFRFMIDRLWIMIFISYESSPCIESIIVNHTIKFIEDFNFSGILGNKRLICYLF